MSQQVRITSPASVPLRPLIEAALRDEARLLERSIRRTMERLRHFETRYGMPSEEFERRFQAGELDDHPDFIEWFGELTFYRLLLAQRDALLGAEIQ
jgi:hypothetical protein